MRALVWDGKQAELVDRPAPQAGEGEVVVAPRLAGVCNTDLEIMRGYLGFTGVMGHELVGEVCEGPARWRGKRVVGEINCGCGHCEMCARGLGRHCSTRTVVGIQGADGAFAEQLVLPEANLHEVPAEISDEAAVFVEPLAAAFEILEQVRIEPGCPALVLGDGKLGLLCALVLAQAGAEVCAVGKHAPHLALLQDRGIETTLLEHWDRAPAELCVEATGSAGGVSLALGATRPRGTLVLKSTVAEQVPLDMAPLVIHEITLVGSRCGPFEPALAALASGRIDPRPLIDARFGLSGALEALERAAEPGALKVLIEPD